MLIDALDLRPGVRYSPLPLLNRLFLAALLSLASTATANELTPVTVTAAPGDSTAQQLHQSDLSQGYSDLAGALQTLSGVQVQSQAAIGDPVMISVQGASPRQTQVRIDGIEAPRDLFGGYDLTLVPIHQIESIELSPVGAGDNAIGGTLDIRTKRQLTPTVSSSLGAYGWRRINWQQPTNDQGSLQLHHLASRNDFDYPVPSPLQHPDQPGLEQALNNAGYRRYDLSLQQRWQPVNVKIGHHKAHKDYPDYFSNRPQHSRYLQQASSLLVSGELDSQQPQQWQLYWRRYDDRYLNRDGSIGLGRQDNRYFGHQLTGQWQIERQLQQHHLQLQLEAQQQRYSSRHKLSASNDCSDLRSACDLNSERQLFSLAAQHQFQLNQQRWVTYLRHRHWSDSSITRSQQGYQDKQQWQDGAISWHSSGSHWSSQLSGKRSIRFASLFERFGNRGLLRASANLKAELAHSVHWHGQLTLAQQTWRLDLFQRWLQDAIVPVYDARGIGRYENTQAARMQGLEGQWQSSPWSFGHWQLTAQLSISRYRSQTQSDIKAFEQQQLAGIYHQQLQAQVSLQGPSQQLQLSYELADDLYLDRANLVAGDPRRLWHAHYRFHTPSWQAGLRINNLSDARYRDYSNRPARPRDWLAYVTLHY